MNDLVVELLNALDNSDKIEQDYALKLICLSAYMVKKTAAQHDLEKIRRTLREQIKSQQHA